VARLSHPCELPQDRSG